MDEVRKEARSCRALVKAPQESVVEITGALLIEIGNHCDVLKGVVSYFDLCLKAHFGCCAGTGCRETTAKAPREARVKSATVRQKSLRVRQWWKLGDVVGCWVSNKLAGFADGLNMECE